MSEQAPKSGIAHTFTTRFVQLPSTIPLVSPTIESLVHQFKAVHGTISAGIRMSVKSQIECGCLLEEMQKLIREKAGSGYWSAWVEENCGVTLRQVQRYIRKAKEFRKLSEGLGSDATAMSLLAQRDMQKLSGEYKHQKKAQRKKPSGRKA